MNNLVHPERKKVFYYKGHTGKKTKAKCSVTPIRVFTTAGEGIHTPDRQSSSSDSEVECLQECPWTPQAEPDVVEIDMTLLKDKFSECFLSPRHRQDGSSALTATASPFLRQSFLPNFDRKTTPPQQMDTDISKRAAIYEALKRKELRNGAAQKKYDAQRVARVEGGLERAAANKRRKLSREISTSSVVIIDLREPIKRKTPFHVEVEDSPERPQREDDALTKMQDYISGMLDSLGAEPIIADVSSQSPSCFVERVQNSEEEDGFTEITQEQPHEQNQQRVSQLQGSRCHRV